MSGNSVDSSSPFSPFVEIAFTSPAADESTLDTNANEIAKKIRNNESSMVGLVEHLGPRLTSTVVQDRGNAVDLLARVFASLPPQFLSEKELEFIVEFLCNRLKDQHLVVPKAIMCCYPIIKSHNLPRGAGARVLHQIFQDANVQSHVHKVRQTVFLTIEFLVRNRMDELKELSTDFLINFLQAMDGEKDPRNLLLLFQIIPSIISNFNLGPFSEDFFEVLSCYFPIDFSPTATFADSKITRETLASALHTCLSHTAQFSEFLIPLALEKLDSSLHEAKIDSLRLMELCCERCYQPENLQPFLPQLWHSLRREVFMGGDEAVERHCILFLQSAFCVVSRDPGTLATFMDLILRECKHHLAEPDLRLIQPVSKILVGMCDASENSCRAVMPQVLPVIHEQLISGTSQGDRKRIMGIVELLLSSCRRYDQVSMAEIEDKWDEMVATWFSLITNDDPEFATLSLKILLRVLASKADFSFKDRSLLIDHVIALMRRKSLPQGTWSAIIPIVKELAEKHGEEFVVTGVPALLDVVCSVEGNESVRVKVIAECCVHHEAVFTEVVSSLLDKVSRSADSNRATLVDCLRMIVEKVNDLGDNNLAANLSSILVEQILLFDKIFDMALDVLKVKNGMADVQHDVNGAKEEFDSYVHILKNVMIGSSEKVQSELLDRYWNVKAKGCSWESLFANIPFPLAEAMLSALRPSVEVVRLTEFTQYLLQRCVQAPKNTSSYEFMYPYQKLLASILNKIESDTQFAALINSVETVVDETNPAEIFHRSRDEMMEVGDGMDMDTGSTCNIQSAAYGTTLLAWVTKGLAMRGVRDLNKWIEKLIKRLQSEVVGEVAAEGFHILVADDDVLNPKSHCKFRFLYKQRIFQMSVPRLVSGYRDSTCDVNKANFLKALTAQLQHIPKEILAMEIESIFPLLVASLKLDTSASVISSTLKAVTEILNNSDEETDKKLVNYCFDIVPQLTQLAQFPANMDVRIMALQCLQKCARCPPHVTLPLRQQVIEGLERSLDDPKRLVRSEARVTRSTWILVGSPGGL